MSQSTYIRARGTAKKLIRQFGQPLTLRTEDVSGGYDENGDPVVPSPSSEVSGNGVKLNYTLSEMDNSSIKSGDAKLLFSTEGKPEIGMLVDIDGETWRVVKPNPLQPAGITILYSMQVRR